ncbi:MAG: hypothetical protein DMG56_22800 [Acidobacteria bacterium]|nr:MAG: hypothetical protein DMG56_22800 [Acidobacteriota bacterium]
MDGGQELALEVGDLSLEGDVLPGILFPELVQIFAQFFVLPQQNEGDKRGGQCQKRKQHKNQLSKGHGISLTWVILDSDVRTTAGKNLAVCFQDHPGSKRGLYKGIKMRYLGL